MAQPRVDRRGVKIQEINVALKALHDAMDRAVEATHKSRQKRRKTTS